MFLIVICFLEIVDKIICVPDYSMSSACSTFIASSSCSSTPTSSSLSSSSPVSTLSPLSQLSSLPLPSSLSSSGLSASVGCSNVEVRFRDVEIARIHDSDRINRVHRARDDSGQNEAERSNAAIGNFFYYFVEA